MITANENVKKACRKFAGEELARICEKNGYKPGEVIFVSGECADAAQFEDHGTETFILMLAEHRGHILTMKTNKYDCGAYSETQSCSCGYEYANGMNGCWQQGHQRDAIGTAII